MGAIRAKYSGSMIPEANIVIPLTPCFSEGMAMLMPANEYYETGCYFDFAAHMSELFEFFRVKKMKFTLKSKIVQSVNSTTVMPVVYGMVDYDARNFTRWVAACQKAGASGDADAVDKNSILDTGNSIEVPWTNDITFNIDATSMNATLSTLRSAKSLSSAEWIAQLSDREHSLGNLFVRIADISGVLSAEGSADIFEVYCDYELEFIKPHAQQLFSAGLPGVDVGPAFTLINICEKTPNNTRLCANANLFGNGGAGEHIGTETIVYDPQQRGTLAPYQIQHVRCGLKDAANDWNRVAFAAIPDHIYQITVCYYDAAKFSTSGSISLSGHGDGFKDVECVRGSGNIQSGTMSTSHGMFVAYLRAQADQTYNIYNDEQSTLTAGDYWVDFTSAIFGTPLSALGSGTIMIADLGKSNSIIDF